MSSRGPRPAHEDTRGTIIAAARAEFAERGYGVTSLRGIARRAGVDPKLVHHYFPDGKAALFAELMDLPAEPSRLVGLLLDGPRDELGQRVVTTFLTVWDGEVGRARMSALLRSATANEDAARVLREFVAVEVFGRIITHYCEGDVSAHDELRAGLAAAQMVGLGMLRYVIGYEPLIAASTHDLVALLAPVIQHHLAPVTGTGESVVEPVRT